MDFREASGYLLERGVTVADIAFAARVSDNSILRARMDSGQRRSPPKGWQAILRGIAEEQAARLTAHASQLTNFAAELSDA